MATFTATVQTGKVSGTNSNFPAYVDLSTLPIAFWNTVTNGGGDIRVYTNSTLTTEIAREVVSCNTTTDTGELWCKVGSMTSSTQVWITVDGTSADYAVGATYGRNNVWSDCAIKISGKTLGDVTGNHTDTLNGGVTAGGVTTNGRTGSTFDGTDDSVSFPTATSLESTGSSYTVSTVLKRNATGGGTKRHTIWGKGSTSAKGWKAWYLRFETNDTLTFVASTYYVNPNYYSILVDKTLVNNTTDLYYITGVFTAGTGVKLYINGTEVASISNTNTPDVSNTEPLYLGAMRSGGTVGDWFNGVLYDARKINSARSADHISTEYQNQNDNSAFWGTWSEVTAVTNQSNFFLLF